MKLQWKKLITCIAVPLIIGGIAGFLTRNNISTFNTLNKPPLSPPGWLFPVIWTILYVLMGIASYIILTVPNQNRDNLATYKLQLAFNFLWSIIFFNLELYLFAFIWLVILWLLILITLVQFYQVSKVAGYLMLPYLIWVTFAGYLNFAIYLLY